MNKKPPVRKRSFVQTPFSHSTLNLERKNFTPQTTCSFAPFAVSVWPKSLLQCDFKNHESEWRDLYKKTEPQYNSNCKKPRAPQYGSVQLCSYDQKYFLLSATFLLLLCCTYLKSSTWTEELFSLFFNTLTQNNLLSCVSRPALNAYQKNYWSKRRSKIHDLPKKLPRSTTASLINQKIIFTN